MSLVLYVYGNKLVVKILVVKMCKKKEIILPSFRRFVQRFSIKHVRKHFRSSRPFRLRPATLLKMRLWYSCFPVNFLKFLRIPYLTEHLRWLLLTFSKIHWKYRCLSLFLIKVFSCKFCKNFKTPNLQNICQKQSSRGVL